MAKASKKVEKVEIDDDFNLMDGLMDDVKKDEKLGLTIGSWSHSTGLKVVDYLNGQKLLTDAGKEIYNLGFEAGKIVYCVGKAGSGKSTMAVQAIGSCMRRYAHSQMFVLDYENSHDEPRIRGLLGMSEKEYNRRVVLKNSDIYTESIVALVNKISAFKKANKAKLLVPHAEGRLDENGNPLMIYAPSFILIDSVGTMMSKADLNAEEAPGQTAGGRSAILNKAMLKKILQNCKTYNIIPFFINQITDNMSMGVTPPEAQTRFLKNTEALAGGKAFIYLSNLILKIDAKDKLEEDKTYKIKGFIANVTLVKSRQAAAGKMAQMIFDQQNGFDDDLSCFLAMKNANKVNGSGWFTLAGDPNLTKFQMGGLKTKLKEDPEFRAYFDQLATEVLASNLKLASAYDDLDFDLDLDLDEISDDELMAEAAALATVNETTAKLDKAFAEVEV